MRPSDTLFSESITESRFSGARVFFVESNRPSPDAFTILRIRGLRSVDEAGVRDSDFVATFRTESLGILRMVSFGEIPRPSVLKLMRALLVGRACLVSRLLSLLCRTTSVGRLCVSLELRRVSFGAIS